jgi:hypothetical protein
MYTFQIIVVLVVFYEKCHLQGSLKMHFLQYAAKFLPDYSYHITDDKVHTKYQISLTYSEL